MRRRRNTRHGLAWLELLLCLAIVALLLQLLPSRAIAIRDLLDIRNWSSTTWFVANALLFSVLLAMRFGPEIIPGFKNPFLSSAQRENKRQAREAIEQRKKLEEDRKLYERMREARKRQVF